MWDSARYTLIVIAGRPLVSFAGDGSSMGREVGDDAVAAKLCAEAFEAVWTRAIPHDQYEIH